MNKVSKYQYYIVRTRPHSHENWSATCHPNDEFKTSTTSLLLQFPSISQSHQANIFARLSTCPLQAELHLSLDTPANTFWRAEIGIWSERALNSSKKYRLPLKVLKKPGFTWNPQPVRHSVRRANSKHNHLHVFFSFF